MPPLFSQAGHEDPPTALWWGLGWATSGAVQGSVPSSGGTQMGFGKAEHPGSRSRCSFPASSLSAPFQRARLPPLLGSDVVLQGSISTAIAKHSPPYLATFQANGDSWYRLQIKVQLLPSSKLCLLPCTSLLPWP